MGMGCTRVVERVCASVGLLSEAPSQFENAESVAQGGVLWALPALLANGLLRHADKYFHLPKGFYSLIQVLLLLGYMALARIKTVEQLQYHPAGEWGKLLGLDRIPEVRTLREKVKALAQPKAVSEWGHTLSQEWMEQEPEAVGFLYVDGHVRVYHGAQTKLPRRYVARQRLCLRGMTDYWVNDELGRPFFVVSSPFTAGLLDMLKNDIVPRLLAEVPGQPSDEELKANPLLHRFTLVFDREGYSPEFFQDMHRLRIACLTYHKFPKQDWAESEFSEQVVSMPHGEQVRMKLAERGTWLGDKLWVREVRKLTESGHQVSILTTNFLADIASIAAHMFARWSQENYFRFMMQHFAIDRLVDYQLGTVDETAMVVNPAYRKLENEIKSKAAKLSRMLARFGIIALPVEMEAPQVAAYETEKGSLKEEIDLLQDDLVKQKAQRKETPKHVRLADLPEGERFVALSPTRKQFLDTIKMIAYRAETALAEILRKTTTRTEETRALLREIFSAEADLLPDEAAGILTVQLHHLANHSSDEAAQHLAEELNETETVYPGTNLRLVYKLVTDQTPPSKES
jgi:hypothetical protein